MHATTTSQRSTFDLHVIQGTLEKEYSSEGRLLVTGKHQGLLCAWSTHSPKDWVNVEHETMLVHKSVIRVGKLTCWVFNDYANVANVNLL